MTTNPVDTMYADVPWYAGNTVAQYFKRYRQVFASPQMKRMLENVPFLAIYDDHEIINVRPALSFLLLAFHRADFLRYEQDFSANETSPLFGNANKAYTTYLGDANPDGIVGHEGENYYDYRFVSSSSFPSPSSRHPFYKAVC